MIPPEEFVRAWQFSKSGLEAWELLKKAGHNVKLRAVYERAYAFRKMGVPLKKMRRGREPYDIERLSRLAKASLKFNQED